MVCDMVAKSPHIIDLEFLPMLAHDNPKVLRDELQMIINKSTSQNSYDKLVLGDGLCGNVTAGLSCDIPMVIPRIHDCCTMFMGSKEKYLQEFADKLSMRWCTNGYYERCYARNGMQDYFASDDYKRSAEYLKLVEEYDEDNAQYIWETMHPPIEMDEAAYIEIDGYEYNNTRDLYEKHLKEIGCDIRILKGDTSFFEKLVNGPWAEDIFLEVLPGEQIVPVYDLAQVFTVAKE